MPKPGVTDPQDHPAADKHKTSTPTRPTSTRRHNPRRAQPTGEASELRVSLLIRFTNRRSCWFCSWRVRICICSRHISSKDERSGCSKNRATHCFWQSHDGLNVSHPTPTREAQPSTNHPWPTTRCSHTNPEPHRAPTITGIVQIQGIISGNRCGQVGAMSSRWRQPLARPIPAEQHNIIKAHNRGGPTVSDQGPRACLPE